MKLFLLTSLVICSATGMFAQNSLTGTISDKDTKERLIGSTIYLTDLRKGASADTNGYYKLTNLPMGIFLAEFKMIGYGSKVQRIRMDNNVQLNIELEQSITEMHELIVTGVSQATEIRQSPIPTTIISKEVMLENTSTNLIDAIARQPGISQITTGGAISKPVIRGLGYNRIITLNNGLRQEGQQWGDEHGIEIDEYSVDRTEVIKGPGSLMYGSDAMAGVINFLASKPVDDGKIIGSVQSNYQTNNGLIGNSFMTAGNIKGFNWLTRFSKKDAHAYSNANDGCVFNSGFNELDYNGMIGLNKKWGYANLTYSSFNQNIGMVEGNRDSSGKFINTVAINDTILEDQQVSSTDLKSYSLFVPRQQINHNRLALQNYFILGKTKLSVNLSLQQNQRKEFGDPFKPNQNGLYFVLNTYSYDVKYFLPEISGFETSMGINGMMQTSANNGIKFLIPEYSLFDYGIFALTKKSYGNLNLSGGLRFDVRTIHTEDLYLDLSMQPTSNNNPNAYHKFQSFKHNYSNLAGSIGLSYNVTKRLLFKINGSRGFRAPNSSELASNGKHEGTLRYEYGNDLLKAETSFQLDAGVNLSSRHITLDVALFQNNITNYIFLERLSSISGGDSIVYKNDAVPTYQYKQGNAVLTGGEISIDVHPHPLDWLHFENSFSYVQGVNAGRPDSSRYLPFVPPAHFQSELRANFKKLKAIRKSYAKVQFDYYFAQNKVLSENKTETASFAYQLINIGFGTDVLSKKGEAIFSIYISLNNVFDVAYQSHLSRIRYAPVNISTGKTGVYNMGRNFSIKVIIPLKFKG